MFLGQDTLSQALMPLANTQPRWYLCACAFSTRRTAQGCMFDVSGTRHAVRRSVLAFGEHAQVAGSYGILASLRHALRKAG